MQYLLVESNVVEVERKDYHHPAAVAVAFVHVQDVACVRFVSSNSAVRESD